jgi:hypothetical protein
MGVHGGLMDRSLSRFSVVAVGALAAVSLLAGCASSGVPGPAVIVPPHLNAAAAAAPAQDVLAGLQQEISNELNAVNLTQSDTAPPTIMVELEALNSPSSLIKAEAFRSLLAGGANQIAKREHVVNELIADVNSAFGGFKFAPKVNGTSLQQLLLQLLDRVNGQLSSAASQLSSASSPDELRTAVTSIGTSTRVYGLVTPMIHLLIAGGAELNAALILSNQAASIAQGDIAKRGGVAGTNARKYFADLQVEIASANSIAGGAVNAVLALNAAGFPGNRSTILSARAGLVQLTSTLGALSSGANDVTQILLALNRT